jgi:5-hydroxyisourate hydrolase
MSSISTHVLDTTSGKPAQGVCVRFCDAEREIASGVTDANGRCSSLLPPGIVLAIGIYRLVFDTSAHFPEGFYPQVTIFFQVRDTAAHYHVPLLISPFGYTTYCGS